jgi:hypothetical protein
MAAMRKQKRGGDVGKATDEAIAQATFEVGDVGKATDEAIAQATFEVPMDFGPTSSPRSWKATVEVTEQRGRLVVNSLQVGPRGKLPDRGLTARLLRTLSLTDAIAIIEQMERDARSRGGSVFPRPPRPHLLTAEERHPEIALAYLQALREEPRSPIAYIERKWGMSDRRPTIRDWVHRAAKAGYLTARLQASPGAKPTDKLRDWAARHGRQIPGEERARTRRKR